MGEAAGEDCGADEACAACEDDFHCGGLDGVRAGLGRLWLDVVKVKWVAGSSVVLTGLWIGKRRSKAQAACLYIILANFVLRSELQSMYPTRRDRWLLPEQGG